MGFRPIILERGKEVRERTKDTFGLWRKGIFNPESNVQFGEGGAGTFSDGKLYTQIKDPNHYGRKVLTEFVKAGAPAEILRVSKPHIGTFKLVTMVEQMRATIESLGGEIRFSSVRYFRARHGAYRSMMTHRFVELRPWLLRLRLSRPASARLRHPIRGDDKDPDVVHPIRVMNANWHNLSIADDCYIGPDVLLDLADEISIGHGAVLAARVSVMTHASAGAAHGSPTVAEGANVPSTYPHRVQRVPRDRGDRARRLRCRRRGHEEQEPS